MHGIKIPQQDFALKMQGAYVRGGGGGGVFAGHYGTCSSRTTQHMKMGLILLGL